MGTGIGSWLTRENIPTPPPDQRLSSVFHDAVGRHSEKPTIFAELIASWFPHQPKLEMFARTTRVGWDCWGNEISQHT